MANTFNPFTATQFTPPATGPATSLGDVLQGSGAFSLGGNVGATSTDSLFAGLLELSFKEVSFPYVRFKTRLRQDLAIHKFADRDGAHVEGMGRSPLEFSARIPMLNGLDAGANEHWQRPLYPFVRDNLLRVAVDKTSGVLQHPELGSITCKLETMEWELDAQTRSGVWVDVTWLETDDTGDDLAQDLAAPSPLAGAQAAANDLTFYATTIDPRVVPKPYVPPITFDDMMNSIRGVVDTPTLLQKQFAGRIDNFIYEANAMRDSLNASANALNWPLLQVCERAKESGYSIKATQLTKGRQILFYVTQKDSTLAQVAAHVGAPLDDVMKLNPAYMGQPVLASGSFVRYYGKK
jgi:hypothetical protein